MIWGVEPPLFLVQHPYIYNYNTPKSSILIRFSIIFTIHVGGPLLFLVQHPFGISLKENPPQVVMLNRRDGQVSTSRFHATVWRDGGSPHVNPNTLWKMRGFVWVCNECDDIVRKDMEG